MEIQDRSRLPGASPARVKGGKKRGEPGRAPPRGGRAGPYGDKAVGGPSRITPGCSPSDGWFSLASQRPAGGARLREIKSAPETRCGAEVRDPFGETCARRRA